MKWKCPYAINNQNFNNAIMCSKEQKEGVDYNDKKNFFEIFCPHQRICNCSKKVINTEQAKKCYEIKRNQ